MFIVWLAFYCRIAKLIGKIRNYIISRIIAVLKHGTIPQHVAFIMDGNRRYAAKQGLGDRRLGHFHGYSRFEQVLDWCFQLGIKCVTVYAFSVENFKRTQAEVTTLMELAVDKLAKLATHSDMIKRNRVGIRIIGELDMLPDSVKAVAMKAMKTTLQYDNFILNICFPYVSRLEMERARISYQDLVSNRSFAHIPEDTLYRACLDTFDSPDVDILIRTSGEWRLSEFLLHQLCVSPQCYYAFSPVMWPEFSFFEFGKILLKYQVSIGTAGKHNDAQPIPSALKKKRMRELFESISKDADDFQKEDIIGR